jgi:hypothetical protein
MKMVPRDKRILDLPSNIWVAAWFVFLSIPAAAVGYYRTFTGFAGWDDEGTMMMMVKQYLGGGKLYGEIVSGYGPVYFFYNRVVRSISGTPLNHDNVRMTSVALLLLCALACAWIVLRFTRSVVLASLVHILTFQTLWFFQQEPGHPQELCILLLVCLVGSGILISPKYRPIVMALMGALPAALLLVKVNIGIFAILAVTLAILYQVPPSPYARYAKLLVWATALALPAVLMKVHFDDQAARVYCFVVTASLGALWAGPLRTPKTVSLSARDCYIAAGSFTMTVAAVLLVLIVQGVSVYASWSSLVLLQLKINVYQRFWYVPVALGRIWLPWAFLGFVAAVVFSTEKLAGLKNRGELLALLKLFVGAVTLIVAFWEPRLVLGFVTPFCWLLLCRPTEDPEIPVSFPRILLCSIAILQTLYAYPLAGSQASFLRVVLIMVGAVLLGDFLNARQLQSWFAHAGRPLVRIAAVGILVFAALFYPVVAYGARAVYYSYPSLSLSGAQRIHVEANQAKQYQWLVRNLSRNCDSFVGLPGMPSLYFWTGSEPPGPAHESPGPLTMDNWLYGLSAEQQQVIVRDFARFPDACVVSNPYWVKFWNKGNVDLSSLPLVDYIYGHFKTVGQMDGYEFMVRKERKLDSLDAM